MSKTIADMEESEGREMCRGAKLLNYLSLRRGMVTGWTAVCGLLLALSGCQAHQKAQDFASPPTAPRPTTPVHSRTFPKTSPPIVSAATPQRHARIVPGVVPSIVPGVVTGRRVLALTFDDGPDPRWTPQVLATLQKWHAPATFFMVGQRVQDYPRLALLVKAAHDPIGNHTWSHPLHPRSPQAEVERTDAILQRVLGFRPTMFRPPYGVLDNGLVKVALAQREEVIGWTEHGSDWDKGARAQNIATKILCHARPGGIALLHDGGGNRLATVEALPLIIAGLRLRGYSLVTVPELLDAGKFQPLPVSPALSGFGIRLSNNPGLAANSKHAKH